jgi:hypothetical protein
MDVSVDYSHSTPEATMVVEKASSRLPGRAPGSSRSRDDDGSSLQYVSGKSDPSFRFFPSRGLIGEGAASWGGPGTLTIGGCGQGLGRAPLWCGLPLAPFHLIFGLRKASVKIGGSAFVSSNSKDISRVTFLKHKNSRKQGTGTMASC